MTIKPNIIVLISCSTQISHCTKDTSKHHLPMKRIGSHRLRIGGHRSRIGRIPPACAFREGASPRMRMVSWPSDQLLPAPGRLGRCLRPGPAAACALRRLPTGARSRPARRPAQLLRHGLRCSARRHAAPRHRRSPAPKALTLPGTARWCGLGSGR